MLNYELSNEMRDAMARDEPAVKAALSEIANARFGTAGDPQGIGKLEGGIRVNGKEIAIKGDYVIDDWGRPREPVAEEQAVVDAINEVAFIIQEKGIEAVGERYGRCDTGDPLRSLLQGPYSRRAL